MLRVPEQIQSTSSLESVQQPEQSGEGVESLEYHSGPFKGV
jgi:hypothetical protein